MILEIPGFLVEESLAYSKSLDFWWIIWPTSELPFGVSENTVDPNYSNRKATSRFSFEYKGLTGSGKLFCGLHGNELVVVLWKARSFLLSDATFRFHSSMPAGASHNISPCKTSGCTLSFKAPEQRSGIFCVWSMLRV